MEGPERFKSAVTEDCARWVVAGPGETQSHSPSSIRGQATNSYNSERQSHMHRLPCSLAFQAAAGGYDATAMEMREEANVLLIGQALAGWAGGNEEDSDDYRCEAELHIERQLGELPFHVGAQGGLRGEG